MINKTETKPEVRMILFFREDGKLCASVIKESFQIFIRAEITQNLK